MNALLSNPSAITIMVECTLMLGVVCVVLLFFSIRQRRRDEHNMRVFVGVVQEELESQPKALRDIGEKQYRLEGEALEKMVDSVAKLERDVYQTIVVAYNRRDGDALGKLHRGIKRLKKVCLDMEPVPDTTALRELERRYDALATRLKEQEARNENLQECLERSQKELSSLMTEYSAAFKKSQEAGSAQ
jgi:hypothetical protein